MWYNFSRGDKMAYVNYKRIYAIKKQNEERIKKVCEDANNFSGIYCFYRINEQGFKFAYVGQATKSVLSRLADHLQGYKQHIDLSIRKYGLYDKDINPFGYKIKVLCHCSVDDCDEKEMYYIKKFADEGWQLKNVTGGSQGKGKFAINESKTRGGYNDGKAQGKKQLARDLRHIIDTHLIIELKKETKTSQKALEKFYKLLEQID